MIQINDDDLPITVAGKIINGVKPYNPTDFMKTLTKVVVGDEHASDMQDMFGLLWTIKHHPVLNDLPYAATQLTEKEENYIRKDIQVAKEVYNRLVDNNYDNPMQAVDDVNELVEALEKGSERNG